MLELEETMDDLEGMASLSEAQTTSLLDVNGSNISYTVSEKPGHILRKHVILCSVFTVIFTAYLAIQNLETSLNQEGNVGLVSLICIYTMCVLTSFVAPTFVRFLGGKWTLVSGWVGQCLFTAANFYPVFWTLVPASVLLGIISVPVWTVQGTYVSRYALDYAKITARDLSATLSKFNGIFFMFFQSTQITGNLISSLILYKDKINGTTISNNSFRSCGANVCPGSTGNGTINVSKDMVYIMMGVFAGFQVIGVLLTVFLVKSLPSAGKDEGLKKSVGSVIDRLRHVNVLLLVPLFLLNGYEQAVMYADFTKSFVTCTIGVREVGFIMVAFGVCDAVTCFLTGPLTDYVDRNIQLLVIAVLHTGIAIFLSVWEMGESPSVVLYVIAGAWGICDAVWQTQTNAHIGHRFTGSHDATFAVLNTFRSLGFALSFALSQFLCTNVKLYSLIGLMGVSFILYFISDLRMKRKDKEDKSLKSNE